MQTERNDTSQRNGQQDPSALKAFVDRVEGNVHPERKPDEAKAANRLQDQQNRMIDKHNLRK